MGRQTNVKRQLTMNYTDFLTGLFDKGEWQALIVTLALTFAITYSIKLFYSVLVPRQYKLKTYVRLIAVFSGMIAAALSWPEQMISMRWYGAGALVGPLSIFSYHIALGVVSMPVINKKAPFLKILIKGSAK